MQLADPIVEILPQPVAMADQLAQNLGRLVVHPGWCGPLLECQTREAGGVDRVCLGVFETGILQAPGEQWVEQRDLVPGRGQRGEQVLPVVSGRFHGDQHRRRAESTQQRLVTFSILADGDRFADRPALCVQPRQHVAFGRNVDAGEHDPSVMCQRPGASEPASMLTLVQARTQTGKAWPQHTVRAANAGRGRQSHAREPRLERAAATLSQQPIRYSSPNFLSVNRARA